MRILSISDACELVKISTKPCIFIDTCILLDIFRIPFRDIPVNNSFEMEKLTTEKSVNLILSEINLEEFERNAPNVKLELERHIGKIKNSMLKIESVSNFIGKGFDLSFKDIDSYKIQDSIHEKIQKFIDISIILKIDPESEVDASRRASRKIAPSQNGEINDSIFYSSFLKMWKELRESSYSEQIIFATSNHNDFGRIGEPLSPIVDELTNNNVHYVNSLSWASQETRKV